MNITVNASKQYEVKVERGLLKHLGEELKQVSRAQRAMIVSDSNVFPLYGKQACDSLSKAGIDCTCFTIPAGEESKNGEVYLQLLEYLAQNQITRSDCIIALGGGVVGDLTGFAAATYLRGIDYIQIPTSLLACVDSSVGGKTAIDLKAGKNLAGAFYQPRLVLCDIDTLDTLPEDIFRDGCAEVIKYGVLYDKALFSHLKEHGTNFEREYVISRCIQLKRDVVAEDEFDRGARQKLNLGHTFGHAVEKHSNFTLSHGKAVAIGMAMIIRASANFDLCSHEDRNELLAILAAFVLPIHTTVDADAIFACALSDKKRFGGTVNLIIPRSIGNCDIMPTEVSKVMQFIKAGL